MKRSAPRPSRIDACSAKRPERSSGQTSPRSPSGPIEPAMKTFEPVTSRASRARRTADELIRSNSSSSRWRASLRRFAPNVFVSISSAPARMKPTWSETTASGARMFASSGVRSRGTAALTSAPMPPSPTIGGPVRRRSTNRLGAATPSPPVSLDILPGLRPGRAWHLAREAGCRGVSGPVPSASLDAERDAAPGSGGHSSARGSQ